MLFLLTLASCVVTLMLLNPSRAQGPVCKLNEYELTPPTPTSNRVCHRSTLDGSAINDVPSDLNLFYRVREDIYIGMASSNSSSSNDDDATVFETVEATPFELPILSRVGGELRVERDASINAIKLASLTVVVDDIDVHTNPALESFSAPALVSSNSLLVHNNPSITSIEVPALRSLRVFHVYGHSSNIHTVDHSSLRVVSDHYLLSGTGVGSVEVSRLRRVGISPQNQTSEQGIEVTHNSMLSGLNLKALRLCGHALRISSNPAMTVLYIPSLYHVEEAFTVAFTAVSSISARKLRQVGSALMIYGNSAATTLNLPNLESISGITFLAGLPQLKYFSVGVKKINGLRSLLILSANSVPKVSFPRLTWSDSVIMVVQNIGVKSFEFPVLNVALGLLFGQNVGMEGLSFPKLTITQFIQLTGEETATFVSFPVLVSVEGNVEIDELISLQSIRFPALATVENLRVIDCPAITLVQLPALTYASLGLGFDNSSCTQILLPELASTSSSVFIAMLPNLQSLAFPKLQQAGNIQIYDSNVASGVIDFPALTRLTEGSSSSTFQNLNCTQILLPSLTWAASSSLFFVSNTNLPSIELPSLVGTSGSINLNGNGQLTSVQLPVLAVVGSQFNVHNSLNLQRLSAPVLARVSGDFIFSFTYITTVSLPQLTFVGGSISFTQTFSLATLDLPLLSGVTGSITLCGNSLTLPFSFPLLTSASTTCRMHKSFDMCPAAYSSCPAVGN